MQIRFNEELSKLSEKIRSPANGCERARDRRFIDSRTVAMHFPGSFRSFSGVRLQQMSSDLKDSYVNPFQGESGRM